MESIRVGVVGLGRMGQRHCRVYSNMRKVQLTCVYDVDLSIGEQIAQQYDTTFCREFESMLRHVDAISIATPTQWHYEQALMAIERGIHVLVEKPIAENLEQANGIINAAESTPVVVQIGHIERFNPAYIELTHVIEGITPIAANFYRLSPYKGSNKDVDVVLDLMIHDTNLAYDLYRREPDKVVASGISVYSEGLLDHVLATLSYGNGQIISLTASRVTEHKVRLIELIAREAYVRCDLLNKNISVRRSTIGEYLNNSQPGVKYHQESVVEWINVPAVEPLVLQQQHFIECIRDGKNPLVSARDGFNAMKLANRIRDLVQEEAREVA